MLAFRKINIEQFCLARHISRHLVIVKINPFTASDEKIFEVLQTGDNLQQVFQGLGRDSAMALKRFESS